ncbi:LLM class flavin-dependent oxidoreductase [Pseudonocardia kujensis]|nr:LLM class flavin-dependent oxidoreductase [Pseudonocardia kujensis]MCE0762023.1 LLM class flavin-dependent oxidoreductase [Pseudonocardia kujensis]
MSTVDGVFDGSWDAGLSLARLADDMDFEAIVPVGRWRGFGGETNFNGEQQEPYAWAAGVGAATEKAGVFVTSHVPTVHPLFAAKQLTTIDHISHGRAALNIVAGWNSDEMAMFGIEQRPHDERYDVAQEWVDVMIKLWEHDGPIDFQGKYFDLKKAEISPGPVQRPRPVLMNAGGSGAGMHFGARNCDVIFVQPGLGEQPIEEVKAKIDTFKKLARDEYGREILVWTLAYVVQEDTETEARRFLDHYVQEKGDWTGAENLVRSMGIGDNQSIPAEVMEAMKYHFIAGWSGRPIVGTSEIVAEKLIELADIGADGVLLSWPRYLEDMAKFQEQTLPLLVEAGAR